METHSEELPETDTWQFVEAHSRWRSVRVVVHPLTADSRTKSLRGDMVWGGRECAKASRSFKRVLWAATLQYYLRRYGSNSPQSALQAADDEMKHISDGDTFAKLPWIRS